MILVDYKKLTGLYFTNSQRRGRGSLYVFSFRDWIRLNFELIEAMQTKDKDIIVAEQEFYLKIKKHFKWINLTF